MQWPLKLFTLEQGTNALKRFKYIRAITALIFIEEVITKEPASARWRVINPIVSILPIHSSIKLKNGLQSTFLQPSLTVLRLQSALLQIY